MWRRPLKKNRTELEPLEILPRHLLSRISKLLAISILVQDRCPASPLAIINISWGRREAQQSRAHTAFTEEVWLLPITPGCSHLPVTPARGDSRPPSGFCRHLHSRAHAPLHIIRNDQNKSIKSKLQGKLAENTLKVVSKAHGEL